MERSRLMQRTAFVAALSLASSIAIAQNVAVVNNKPIPKAREDAWVKELTKQGQADSPELRKQVKDRLIQNEILLQVRLGSVSRYSSQGSKFDCNPGNIGDWIAKTSHIPIDDAGELSIME